MDDDFNCIEAIQNLVVPSALETVCLNKMIVLRIRTDNGQHRHTIVDAKSWGSDVPSSIQTARDYYERTEGNTETIDMSVQVYGCNHVAIECIGRCRKRQSSLPVEREEDIAQETFITACRLVESPLAHSIGWVAVHRDEEGKLVADPIIARKFVVDPIGLNVYIHTNDKRTRSFLDGKLRVFQPALGYAGGDAIL